MYLHCVDCKCIDITFCLLYSFFVNKLCKTNMKLI